jgi:hypothetical protein
MATSRKAIHKTAAKTQRSTAGDDARYKVRARPGKAGAGKVFAPSAPLAMNAGQVELRESRPYTSRYPIPDAEFVKLKERAPTAKLGKVKATRADDSGTKNIEPAHQAMGAPAQMPGQAPSMAPIASANFEGISASGWLPPDCTMATGPEHVLISVNSSVAIHPKGGGAALLSHTLTAWFANVASNLTIFDPKALYDQHAGRWILLAVAFAKNPNRAVFLLSCSKSADPMGGWHNYSLNAMMDGATLTNNWADYPGLGVDSHAIYLTSNMFAFGGGFKYAKVRVVPKSGPYGGGAAPYTDFVGLKDANGQQSFTVTPCHTFGAPQVEYLVNSMFPGGNTLSLWNINNSTGTPVLTRKTVNVSTYSLPPNAAQKGGGTPLNTGDIRVLHAVFRGDSIWTAFTTAHAWGEGENAASIHWFQIRGATATLVQEGIYGSSNKHYFYPASCPDNNGNLIMVFSRSGTSEFAQIRYTGRQSTDPLGKLQTSSLLKGGTANYVALDSGGRNRWGDYAGVASDPANSRLVWFYSMYAVPGNQWATRVGSAIF